MAEREYITITGARVNNLKNISLKIPRGKLCVVTGVSGSGKSMLRDRDVLQRVSPPLPVSFWAG